MTKYLFLILLLTGCHLNTIPVGTCLIKKEAELYEHPDVFKILNVGNYTYRLDIRVYPYEHVIFTNTYDINEVHKELMIIDCPKAFK